MRAVHLGGASGPAVSALCLGTLPFGSTVDERTSFAILDRFREAGGTFLDTANNYVFWAGTGDESETVVGRWLASRGARDEMVVATKIGARPRRAGGDLSDAEGLSAPAVRTAVEASLRRLGVDRLDVCYAHIEDRSVPLTETLGAFADLVDRQRIAVLGCSNHALWRLERARGLARAHGWPAYTCVQQRHSYLRPRPGVRLPEAGHTLISDELLDYARHEPDLTLLAYSSLLFGAYTRADKPLPEHYDHPGTTRRLAVLRAVAAELGATPNQVVLAWLLAGDPPVLPVVGVSTVAQVEECLAATELTLDEEVLARLDAPA
ncbi:aldo/keto reductase [Goodfellowiella coeruleoviolacea]|uniref:Oxidoreductase n=1 Tax=Goodfellowiella coeruleoviolacea TaxID=334858 RepID=A0AAE3GG41_9PSEU|nr:aldo/keto reductase [Goodfellowiella coeruleoviolacea]MCP2167606.1 putative oxidoreductase [Goodfellowiella coeruleoviolacea]